MKYIYYYYYMRGGGGALAHGCPIWNPSQSPSNLQIIRNIKLKIEEKI